MPDSLTSNYFIVRPGSWGKVVGTLADAVDYDSLVVISATEITVSGEWLPRTGLPWPVGLSGQTWLRSAGCNHGHGGLFDRRCAC